MTTLTTSFDDLKNIKASDVFYLRGDQHIALENATVSICNGYECLFIRANRRNRAMLSGWECADVVEHREIDATSNEDPGATYAMEMLQQALNALDTSMLTQIAEHLERFRDMATKDAQDYGFEAVKHVIQSDHYDTVRSLATYCRVAINAQTGKTAVKEGN